MVIFLLVVSASSSEGQWEMASISNWNGKYSNHPTFVRYYQYCVVLKPTIFNDFYSICNTVGGMVRNWYLSMK